MVQLSPVKLQAIMGLPPIIKRHDSVGYKARKLNKNVQATCTPFPQSQLWNTFLLLQMKED